MFGWLSQMIDALWNGRKWVKRAVAISLLAVLLSGLGAVALTSIGAPAFSYLPRFFDPAEWQAADAQSVERCRMLLDLRYRVGLEGRTKEEVQRLLGVAEADDRQASTYVLCPSVADFYVLEIGWEADRVRSVRVRDT